MINTVIIDPLKQDREKITSLLSAEKDIKVLAWGKDGYDAIKLIGSLKPDVAILDNQLEFIEGEEIPPLLKIRSPLTAVVILTARISDYQLFRAASNEVSGFVYKETCLDTLPGILKCVSSGGCFISPALAAQILQLLSTISFHSYCKAVNKPPMKKPAGEEPKIVPKNDPAFYLSKMELRILAQIGEGFTSEEIAENLGLVVGTVRNYTSAVMRKTGVRNRLQLVRYAFYYGLVSPAPSWYIPS